MSRSYKPYIVFIVLLVAFILILYGAGFISPVSARSMIIGAVAGGIIGISMVKFFKIGKSDTQNH